VDLLTLEREALELACEALDWDPDLVWLVRELLAFEPDLEGREELFPLILGAILALQDGSTRIPLFGGLSSPVDHCLEMCGSSTDTTTYDRLLDVLSRAHHLAGDVGAYRPFIRDGNWLYHHRSHVLETELVEMLQKRIGPGTFSVEEVSDALRRIPSHALSDEQLRAISVAASQQLSIVTGGPGTGKTTIILNLIHTLLVLGVPADKIVLAAPTGKAANRMAERVREIPNLPAPRTLHRVLEYSQTQRTFKRDRYDPLRQMYVIVDEASMIDLHMMRNILDALGDAHLVLLGDAQQLPSVESGTVLRDLIPANTTLPYVIQLHTSFRQREDDPAGASILEHARGIQNGEVTSWSRMALLSGYNSSHGGVSRLVPGDDHHASLARFADAWSRAHIFEQPVWKQLIEHVFVLDRGEFSAEDIQLLDCAFEVLGSSRILCVTRKRASGSIAINEAIHSRYCDALGISRTDHGPGMPVMMLHNDYGRGLFNGDQGLLARVQIEGVESLMAVFPSENHYRAHHLTALESQIDVAFAMTVHKAQGSEFDSVVVVLPFDDMPLITRENLYTAVTRARRGVCIFSTREMFETAVQRPVRRFSGVAEKLARLMSEK
jgi:exodeoxyribonuclease V alpha subunit